MGWHVNIKETLYWCIWWCIVQTPNGLAGGVLPAVLTKPPPVDGKCVYQPATVAYQQMALAGMQLQQQAYVPITSQYTRACHLGDSISRMTPTVAIWALL